jgi:hypothetical protein
VLRSQSFIQQRSSGRLAGVVLAMTLLAVGCGDSGPFEYIPVQGKVTFEDGTPIPAAGIMLQFQSLDAKPVGDMHPRPATAGVDGNGDFKNATSLKYGDGLIPGRHKVALQYATDAKGKLLIPPDYAHLGTTPLIVETGDGVIEIKVPRPK